MFKIVKNRKKGICVAHRCKKKHSKKNRFCSKHNHRYQKVKNPIRHVYNTLKVNARRRNKSFTLTIKEFTQFCKNTGYMQTKGRAAWKSTIDRIDPDKGYSFDNIQILSNRDNVRKMHSDKTEQCNDDLPF